MEKLKIERQKLFDGLEDEFYSKKFCIEINESKIEFIVFEITPNKLYKSDFKNKLDLIDSEFILNKEENIYKNIDNLPLYYLIKDNYFILFALGEYQPGRYMLFLEGVWDLN